MCVSCTVAPSFWATFIICFVVTGCVLWLAIDAWINQRGSRWFATMLGGAIFGEVVEYLNTHGGGCNYCYPALPINILGVPYWVPLGWGGIIYASIWTAQQLRIHWVAQAMSASFLAVSIDFSLDPIARLLKFWTWQYYPVSFDGVPYDNYTGWYLIVLVYALATSIVLGRTRASWNIPGATFTGPWWRSGWIQWRNVLACVLLATGMIFVVGWAMGQLGYYPGLDGGAVAAEIFLAATFVGAFVTILLVRRRARVPMPAAATPPVVSWPVLLVPVIIHLTCLLLYFLFAKWQEPVLVAAIPIQLLAGVFVFAQPWFP